MSKMNTAQTTAINHFTGPMVVLAGPGSGKTTVISHRILELITKHHVAPNRILVIAFSKSATVEMTNRFKKLSNDLYSNVNFNTFHSLFFRIIRNHHNINMSDIISDEEKKYIVKDIIIKEKIIVDADEDFMIQILNEISLIKNELIDINHYDSLNMSKVDFITIFNCYEKNKSLKHKIDFDDMLSMCYNLFLNNESILNKWQNLYDFILIDEFQDINKVQYECIKLLAKPKNNLFIVGDDDQSIFGFRGARPEFLLKFPKEIENTQKVILDVNYRSTNHIIKLAGIIVKENKVRYEKIIVGNNKIGILPKLIKVKDIREEAFYIADKIIALKNEASYEDIAIIFRTNIQSRAFVDALMDRNIPFQLKDISSSIYEHWIANDIISYLKLSANHSLDKNFVNIVNKPNRYISKAIIAKFSEKECKDGLLTAMYKSNSLEKWQLSRLDELIFSLKAVKSRSPYEAIKYIRKGIGYDDYIVDYANYRKIKPKALYEILDELQESSTSFATTEEFLNHIEVVITSSKEKKKDKNNTGVTLTTMHSSKGLEFSVVFVVGCVEGLIPYEKSKTPFEIEEERRLFYVAITRAKDQLYLSVLENRHEKQVTKTRFLDCIK